MTNKVQKIRAEIKRRMLEDYNSDNEEQDVIAQGVCAGILYFIDSLQEEPVSEDLEQAAMDYDSCRPALYGEDDDGDYVEYIEVRKDAFIAGAKWKEQQFEKNRLAACDKQTEKEAKIESDFVMGIIENEHRLPTFDDVIKYGMRLQKEQMMADAIDVEVKADAGGYPYIDKTIELYDYDKDVPLAKAGEKVKVIVIKED